MKQSKFFSRVAEVFASTKVMAGISFFIFVTTMTCILASQNFFFQNVIKNGISQRDIVAQKTLTVIDVKKTEQHRKEIAQKIDPILTPAEDEFIKNNLSTLENSISQIRKKETPSVTKKEELALLFDISEGYRKNFVINYLLKTSDDSLQSIYDKANLTLSNILSVGITEKDYESSNIDKIIQRNLATSASRSQLSVITAMLEQIIMPNLVVDEFATDIARKNAMNSVKPYEITFKKGDKIVFEGEPVTKLKRDALRQAGYNLLELNWQGLLGIFSLVALVALIFLKYLKDFEKDIVEPNRILLMAILSILFSIIPVLFPTGASPYILPLPALIIVVAIFMNARVAFTLSMCMLVLITVCLQYSIQFSATFILLNLFSAIAVSQIKFTRRFDLIKTGLEISIIGIITVTSVYMLEKCLIDIENTMIIRDMILIAINGFVSGIIALGTIPLFESAFRIITPYGLAELADHNQPLLKRLQFEAPGTYHHSLMVSNLCEAAAEAVGANPILARVGAFYHDIGKLKRPLFFVENQSYFGIENPHTKLNPRLSKMVITAHPKDGVELAKEYSLPPIINNFILQHHGEGLASYFYNQAIKEEGIENVKEEQFRYTGPKPNSKEAAILMIADAVESAVRSLKNPTPEEMETLINKLIVERLNDGQLEDSPLTLKDIKTIAATFNRILRGMQHNRIKYHEDIVHEFDKNKIQMTPKKVIDKDLEEKIKQLENQNIKEDGKNND